MTALNKRQLQAFHTKEKIVNTALIAFDKHGYDNLTIRDICKEANISVGTFYHHFQSKEDIIDKVYETFDLYLIDQLGTTSFASFHEGIHALIGLQLKQIEQKGHSVVAQLFKMQLSAGNKYILNRSRYFYTRLLEIANNGIAQNEVNTSLSADELVDTLLRIARGGIYDWCLHEGIYPLTQTVLDDIQLCFPNKK